MVLFYLTCPFLSRLSEHFFPALRVSARDDLLTQLAIQFGESVLNECAVLVRLNASVRKFQDALLATMETTRGSDEGGGGVHAD
jgi:hypothetical protein